MNQRKANKITKRAFDFTKAGRPYKRSILRNLYKAAVRLCRRYRRMGVPGYARPAEGK